MNMNLREIQSEIESLPAEQRRTLLDWLMERVLTQWDVHIAQDFSPGGAGMELLASIKARVGQGESALLITRRRRR